MLALSDDDQPSYRTKSLAAQRSRRRSQRGPLSRFRVLLSVCGEAGVSQRLGEILPSPYRSAQYRFRACTISPFRFAVS